jgi:hypothetical protein
VVLLVFSERRLSISAIPAFARSKKLQIASILSIDQR